MADITPTHPTPTTPAVITATAKAPKAKVTTAPTPKAAAPSASKLAPTAEEYRQTKLAEARYWIEGLSPENAAPYYARLTAITHPAEAFDLKVRAMLHTLELILAAIDVAEAKARREYKIEAFTERFITPEAGKSTGWLQYIKSQIGEQLHLARDEGKVDWHTFPAKGGGLIKLFPYQVAQLERAIKNGEGIVHALENPRYGEKLMTPTWGVRSPGKTARERVSGKTARTARNRADRASKSPRKGGEGKKKK